MWYSIFVISISPEKLEVVSETIANAVEVAVSSNCFLDDESVVVEAVDSIKEKKYRIQRQCDCTKLNLKN